MNFKVLFYFIGKTVVGILVNWKQPAGRRAWQIDGCQFRRCSTFHGILVTARGTETAVAAKRNELKISTVWAAVHSTTKRRITTVYHLFDIFHLRSSVMKSIFNFFIIVGKDSLQDIHMSIMQKNEAKEKPTPQDWGAGELNRRSLFFISGIWILESICGKQHFRYN